MNKCGSEVDVFDDDCSLTGRMFIRNPYNYSMDCASLRSGLSGFEPTRTQQSFKEETDINTIMQRFGVTGQLPVGARMPSYGDFDTVSDYQSALHAVMEAERNFMLMPAEVRDRFKNDPGQFVDFFADPANFDEAVKLGLVPAKQEGGEPKAKEGEDPPKG